MSQPSLDLRNQDGTRVTFQRPMLGVESWRAITGLSEDDLLAEITNGKVRFAFNVARKTGNDARSLIRVWNRSIICFLNPALPQPDVENLKEALNYILPHRRDTFRGTDLMRALNVSSTHISNLVEDGSLVRLPGDLAPNESPTVTRASVVNFLTERRIQ